MRVALIQQACEESKSINLQATIDRLEIASAEGARLALLQELHTSRYFCIQESPDSFDLAEPLDGETVRVLAAEAERLNLVIVGSIFEHRAPGLYHNTAVVLDTNGQLAGYYRKMHIPDDPGFYEKFYFTPGDTGFEPIRTSIGKLGILVCWDQWFPEAARLMTLAGAELLLYPTAIGWMEEESDTEQQRQREAWEIVQRGHAVANGIPVLVCNRVGHEEDPSGQTGGIRFWGSSFACGPQGEILAQAPDNHPSVLLVDISTQRTEEVRRMWPFLRDRRIDAYQELTQRYRD